MVLHQEMQTDSDLLQFYLFIACVAFAQISLNYLGVMPYFQRCSLGDGFSFVEDMYAFTQAQDQSRIVVDD